MAFRIPDVLRYEIQHRLEGLRGGTTGTGPREWLNAHPTLIAGVASLSIILVVLVLASARRPVSGPLMRGKTAWFYDVNTGKLFQGSPRETGPIKSPSGPTPDGAPAGFRAHVYSYVMEPNDSELFTGFLEQPDPESEVECSASDMRDFDRWAQSRLIRRPDDKNWVQATSVEGQAILRELTHPDKQGRMPIYHVPRTRSESK